MARSLDGPTRLHSDGVVAIAEPQSYTKTLRIRNETQPVFGYIKWWQSRNTCIYIRKPEPKEEEQVPPVMNSIWETKHEMQYTVPKRNL